MYSIGRRILAVGCLNGGKRLNQNIQSLHPITGNALTMFVTESLAYGRRESTAFNAFK